LSIKPGGARDTADLLTFRSRGLWPTGKRGAHKTVSSVAERVGNLRYRIATPPVGASGIPSDRGCSPRGRCGAGLETNRCASGYHDQEACKTPPTGPEIRVRGAGPVLTALPAPAHPRRRHCLHTAVCCHARRGSRGFPGRSIISGVPPRTICSRGACRRQGPNQRRPQRRPGRTGCRGQAYRNDSTSRPGAEVTRAGSLHRQSSPRTAAFFLPGGSRRGGGTRSRTWEKKHRRGGGVVHMVYTYSGHRRPYAPLPR